MRAWPEEWKKRGALRFALLALFLLASTGLAGEKPVRLLTVGNSFAVNATTYLPQMAEAGGHALILLNAYKGGCSLQEHAAALAAAQTDRTSAAARIYDERLTLDGAAVSNVKFNLIEALQREKWDFVTVQQASPVSYLPESYEPYAAQIIAAIRQYDPQAEILVHETWAYRDDEPRFAKGDFTPALMQEGLKAAYAQLAAAYRLRTIPVGNAFQAARVLPRWAFVPDAAFDFTHPVEGQLPHEQGGLHIGWSWKKDPATGVSALKLDGHHANVAGRYLGSAVFYEVLFGANVEDLSFCPPSLSPEDAAELRRIAHQEVAAQKALEAKRGAAPAS